MCPTHSATSVEGRSRNDVEEFAKLGRSIHAKLEDRSLGRSAWILLLSVFIGFTVDDRIDILGFVQSTLKPVSYTHLTLPTKLEV